MMRDTFVAQVRLLLRALPHAAAEPCFALKGGTAINLFVRDMPRLSVDIDLTYVHVQPRDTSFAQLEASLLNIAAGIERTVPGAKVQRSRNAQLGVVTKLVVATPVARIKIEPNLVLRGTVFAPQARSLCPRAEEFFELAIRAQTLSSADLYAGKLCAALDRQHPRDLFDIKTLLECEGLTDDIRQAFVVYLACHGRPMNELLDPPRKDVLSVYENDFRGMTTEEVGCDALLETREVMITTLTSSLTRSERLFLVSLKAGEPDWSLLGRDGVERLPAIQWKLINIRKMEKTKRLASLQLLRARLGLDAGTA